MYKRDLCQQRASGIHSGVQDCFELKLMMFSPSNFSLQTYTSLTQ